MASGASSPSCVELSELKDLTIRSLPPQMAHMILTTIRVPNCKSLRIQYEKSPNGTYGLLTDPAMQHLTSRISSAIAAPKRRVIRCSANEVTITLQDAVYDFVSLTFNWDWQFTPPDGLANALEMGESSEVVFEIHGNCSTVGIQPLLPSRCNITTITMSMGPASMDNALLRFLTQPVATNDGKRRWPVAGLEMLLVDYGQLDREGLVEMIPGRWVGLREDGSGESVVVEPCKPMCFGIRDDRNLEPDNIKELRPIFGSNFIYSPTDHIAEDDEEDGDDDDG
ncbi:hypothetical protein FRB94_006158 [Tulasnella sp. JGI-2019a]|nr:hypothetical protein FRB94_006158 [Tulasnella sp. JGI-2019a]